MVATAVAAVAGMLVVFLGSSQAATYTWFIGAGLGFVLYMVGSKLFAVRANYPAPEQQGVAR